MYYMLRGQMNQSIIVLNIPLTRKTYPESIHISSQVKSSLTLEVTLKEIP